MNLHSRWLAEYFFMPHCRKKTYFHLETEKTFHILASGFYVTTLPCQYRLKFTPACDNLAPCLGWFPSRSLSVDRAGALFGNSFIISAAGAHNLVWFHADSGAASRKPGQSDSVLGAHAGAESQR